MRRALRVDGGAWALLAALLCSGAIVVTAICAGSAGALGQAPLARALDWRPALGLHQPWRLWTCAWVHASAEHLLVNVAGAIVVAFVGWRGRLPATAALAWLAAWPLVQVAMATLGAERLAAVMPRYDGLSGVLHAGVMVAGLSLAWPMVRAPARGSRPPPPPPLPGDAEFVPSRGSAIEPSRITEGPWAMTDRGSLTAVPASTLDQAAIDPPPVGRSPERWIGLAIVAGTVAKVVLEAPWNLTPRPSAALGIAVAPVAHACGIAAGLLAWGAVRVLRRRGG